MRDRRVILATSSSLIHCLGHVFAGETLSVLAYATNSAISLEKASPAACASTRRSGDGETAAVARRSFPSEPPPGFLPPFTGRPTQTKQLDVRRYRLDLGHLPRLRRRRSLDTRRVRCALHVTRVNAGLTAQRNAVVDRAGRSLDLWLHATSRWHDPPVASRELSHEARVATAIFATYHQRLPKIPVKTSSTAMRCRNCQAVRYVPRVGGPDTDGGNCIAPVG